MYLLRECCKRFGRRAFVVTHRMLWEFCEKGLLVVRSGFFVFPPKRNAFLDVFALLHLVSRQFRDVIVSRAKVWLRRLSAGVDWHLVMWVCLLVRLRI